MDRVKTIAAAAVLVGALGGAGLAHAMEGSGTSEPPCCRVPREEGA
jgi:hypothetical protein